MKTKDFLLPATSLSFLTIAYGFFTTYVPMFLQLNGASNDTIALISSSFALGILLSSLKCHRLIEKIGLKNSFSACLLLLTLFNTLQAFFTSTVDWVVLRFLSGIFMGSLFIITESWALALSSLGTKSRTVALYTIIFNLAQGLGPLILIYLNIYSYAPYIINLLFSVISLFFLYILPLNIPSFATRTSLNLLHILKLSPIGAMTAFTAGLIIITSYSFLPVFVSEGHNVLNNVPMLISASVFGGILFQWPIGYLADFFKRKKIVFLTAIALVIVSLLTAVYPQFLILEIFIFGGFAFTLYPLSMAHTSDLMEKEKWAAAISALSILYGMGSIIGPPAAAFFIDKLGPQGLFYFFAVVSFILSGFSLRNK